MTASGPHPEAPAKRASKDEDLGGKSDLRKILTERRARLQAERGWWAAEVAMALLPRIEGVGVVAGYWPMRSEIDPRPLMKRYARAGWRLALPVTPAKGEGPLTFKLWTQLQALQTHAFGMLEPGSDAEIVRPDVVIVPMLGFDETGHRLGYGAGHYDRTLAALRAEGAVTAIGLAFAGQEVDRLPTQDHDQPLDAILTEREYRAFATDAG